MSRTMIMLAACCVGLVILPVLAKADSGPIFHLSFEKGLRPDIGPDTDCKWVEAWAAKATEPPTFDDRGLSGKALLIGDDPARAGYIAIPPAVVDQAKDRGTFVFWLRGLENWHIWGMGEGAQGGVFVFLGGGMIYKWEWYEGIALFGNGPTLFYPHFDQYQWTQLGVSWQKESDGKTRNRIYLNGKMVGETTGNLNLEGLRFGSQSLKTGGRLLIDDFKLWNRVLPEPEMKRLYRQDGQWATQPVVTVPRLPAAPVIDGKINPAEWANAARITGLLDAQSGETTADQSAFFLGYDDRLLYVAMVGEMTEQARTNPAAVIERFLRAEATGHTDKIATDDLIELMFSPDIWKVTDHRKPGAWTEFQLLANAAGGYQAGTYSPKGMEPLREMKWQTASTVGASGWQFEACIPLDTFGAQPPVAGDRWGLQVGRHWQQLKQASDRWAWGSRATADKEIVAKRSEPYKFKDSVPEQPDLVQRLHLDAAPPLPHAAPGVLEFAGAETPTVRVERLGNLQARTIDFAATLMNPAPTSQKVTVRLFTDTDTLRYEETFNLATGGTREVARRQEITDFATSLLTFEVADAAGKVIHRTAAPIYLKQAFGVWLAQRPNYEKFLLDLDLGTLSSVPAPELRLDVQLTDTAGTVAYAEKDRSVSSHIARMEFPAKGIAPGAYTLAVTIRRKDTEPPRKGLISRLFAAPRHGDTVLAQEKLDFTQYPKAPWYGNRYGREDMDLDVVPYPWTDMTVTSGKDAVVINKASVIGDQKSGGSDPQSAIRNPQSSIISVWGREYRFGKGLYPEQITTLSAPMLRAPMRVLLKTADGETLDSAALEAQGEWSKTNRTRVEGSRTVAQDRLALTSVFWSEYDGLFWSTLTLNPKGKISIASMELEIPLNPAFTDVVKGNGAVGLLKPEGYQQIFDKIWLGNGDGGIQWLPGEATLHVRDAAKVVRVEVTPEGATLRIVLIDTPTELAEPYAVQFGFNVTPVRPNLTRTPFFRARSTRGGGAFYPKGLESLPAADPGLDFYGYGSKAGNLYVWTATVSTAMDASGTEDFKRYGAEWMSDPFQRPQRGWETNVISPTTASDSFRDYFIWRYWRYQQKYGYCGHYCDNPGGGSTLEVRDLLKRLYNVTSSNRHFAAREDNIGIASNGGFNMGFGGFFTYQWDGEHLNSRINSRQPTYRGVLDPAAYRAEYMGHNYGWPVYFLGQARLKPEWVEANGGPEAVIDQVQGLELLHDVQPSGWHIPGTMDQVCKRAQDAVKKQDLTHWIYQFTPYWRQDMVALPDKNMHASFYIARPSQLAATSPTDEMGYPWGNRAVTFCHYFDRYMPKFEYFPYYVRVQNFYETETARKEFTQMQNKAVMVVYNNTEWAGEMRLKPDWTKLGLGAPETLRAENAVHRTGFRIDKEKDKDGKDVEKAVFFDRPAEFAKIENGELVFPMTKFNYRMIVLEKK